jgi:DNA ligase D-like protein (predicted ligase)
LRGAWSLVRLAKSQKDWLLIKERDAYVVRGGESNLSEASVLSGLTIEEVRDGSPRWAEVRAQVAKLPPSPLRADQVQLMLAETRPQSFSEPGWLFEIKYDGFRALAAHEGGRGKLLYRHGSDATALYPDLAAALAALPADVVLDGEITVCDEQGRPSFERLQRRALLTRQPDIEHAALSLPASLFVFDLLAFENRDLRSLPLSTRKALLSRLLPTVGPLHYVDHIETRGQEMFEEIARLGLEGVMAKRAESPYRAGRSPDWLKIRRDRSTDFAVVGYTAPRGLRSGLGALHLAALESGALVYMGRVGSGLSEKDLASLPQELHDDVQAEPPCSGPVPRGREHTWVKPRLVCEVRYKEITSDGLLRQPIFLRWRTDKRPEECARPQTQAEPPIAKPDVEKRIAFTNLTTINGQLGNGVSGYNTRSIIPATVSNADRSSLSGVSSVVVGDTHSCALLADKTVKCWGDNHYHQLGNGSNTPSVSPVSVLTSFSPSTSLTNVTVLVASHDDSCAIRSGGSVYCWGDNGAGELGNGNSAPTTVAVNAKNITATAVGVGSVHSCAVGAATVSPFNVQCWGDDFYGQLGDKSGTTGYAYAAVHALVLKNASAMALGRSHSCAVMVDSTIECWGYNAYGQLGNGGSMTDSDVPVSVTLSQPATSVCAGEFYTCAVTSGGAVYCWGDNELGQIGNGKSGKNLVSAMPVLVSGF